jgi:hypothetical protein
MGLSLNFCLANWPQFVEHLSQTKVVQQYVTKVIPQTFLNLVTPKAEAKHELLVNNPAFKKGFVEHLSSI